MVRLEVIGGHVEREYLTNRFREKGILYNIHYPMNPEDIKEKGRDYVVTLNIVSQSYEYRFL